MPRDVTKMKCQAPDCGFGAEAIVHWKLGKGVDLPFTGGKVGLRDGIHLTLNLCKQHRIQSIDAAPRPYKVVTTAWYANPQKYDVMFDHQGNMLLPGVAVSGASGEATS